MPIDPQRRIALLDDDRLVCAVLAHALRDRFRVEVRHSVEAAGHRLEAWRDVDLLLCDEQLDGARGTDLLATLVAISHPAALRVLFMTGGTSPLIDARLRAAGGGLLLYKPFGVAQMFSTIEARLEQLSPGYLCGAPDWPATR